ncbi:cation transport protein-domain-containing protein [Lactarius deliciosus]|nr:cation transport protein-domain-containing protein [Lactarius deliciosus]
MTRTGQSWGAVCERELNFFRIHLAFFMLLPIVSAGVLVASNGRFYINYTDALFVCVSGMTGTGLATIDLSSLTAWQQVIIVLVSLVGSPVFVSLVTVYFRKRYLTQHLDLAIKSEFDRTQTRDSGRRTMSLRAPAGQKINPRRVHNNMAPSSLVIHRVDTEPKLISSMDFSGIHTSHTPIQGNHIDFQSDSVSDQHNIVFESPLVSSTPTNQNHSQQHLRPRLTRQRTVQTINPQHKDDTLGFGNPVNWFVETLQRFFPSLGRNIHRTLTIPDAPRLLVSDQGEVPPGARPVSYLSFKARVGHNSRFIGLSDDDYEELGGVEYRALSALLWIVSGYYFVTLLISVAVLAPYMSMSKWKDNFRPPNQHRVINPVWFSAFQVVGAWANTGLSLVDQNLIPFQTAYPLLMFMVWLALAGNTGFLNKSLLVSLRLTIWINYKLTPKRSKWRETLHFLLDHPRRCFIYLFPSRQTWFLLTVLVILNFTDWFLFLVLNIGIPVFDAVPVGRRFILGLVQAVSVRFAGFQSIAISALAPALQVVYFVMMYVSAYPIAMSVRSTNVYEERSLGIFEVEEDDIGIENEEDYPATDSRVAVWGRYLARHTRRQLSFAHALRLRWHSLASFLMRGVQRAQLRNPDNASWFTTFAVFFEIVSAYGTVGLSLGIPSKNFSLSGAMSKLSKLIICAVMLRGRHRGLPVALDRAIVFPTEFVHKAGEKVRGMKMAKRQAEAAAEERREKLPTVNED